MVNIEEQSNVGEGGRFVFRVENSFVKPICGGAEEETQNNNSNNSASIGEGVELLRLSPAFVGVHGHVPIVVKGTCLDPTSIERVMCRFTPLRTNSGRDGRNSTNSVEVQGSIHGTEAICIAPYFYHYGRVLLNLTVERNDSTKTVSSYTGYLYVEEAKDDDLIVHVNDHIFSSWSGDGEAEGWNLSLKWNPAFFSGPSRRPLELVLVEFKKDGITGSGAWNKSHVVSYNEIVNTGSWNGIVNIQEQLLNQRQLDSMVHFQLRESDSRRTKRNPVALVAGALGFIARRALIGATLVPPPFWKPIGVGAAKVACEAWHALASRVPPESLEPCPKSLSQAEQDGRFKRSDAILPRYHPGAAAAFRQRTPNKAGAGQQCTYDESGYLMVGSPGGGTADISSPNGLAGIASHFFRDVLPWWPCCEFAGEPTCTNKYYDKRPSDNGSNYEPPANALGNGDPHFTTFDSVSYTFNGVGEFWLVKTGDGSLAGQVRMEQYMSSTASIFTAFVFSDNNFNIQIQRDRSSAGGIIVLVDGIVVPFYEDNNEHSVYLATVTISKLVQNPPKIHLSFSSGFSFTITAPGPHLNIIGQAPRSQQANTYGLFGFYDGNPENDLKAPNGTVTAYNDKAMGSGHNLKEIHYDFGLKWMISEDESLFTYVKGTNYSTFSRPDFTPSFFVPDITITTSTYNNINIPSNVRTLCGNSTNCIFDFIATGSLDFANETRSQELAFERVVQIGAEKVPMCPPVANIENGRYNVRSLYIGAIARFECDSSSFELIGNSSMKCEKSESLGATIVPAWSGTEPICQAKFREIATTPSTTTTTITAGTTEITTGEQPREIPTTPCPCSAAAATTTTRKTPFIFEINPVRPSGGCFPMDSYCGLDPNCCGHGICFFFKCRDMSK